MGEFLSRIKKLLIHEKLYNIKIRDRNIIIIGRNIKYILF